MDTLYEVDWYKAYPAYPLNFKKSIYVLLCSSLDGEFVQTI